MQIINILNRRNISPLYIPTYPALITYLRARAYPPIYDLIGIIQAINEKPVEMLKIYFEELYHPLPKFHKLEYIRQRYYREFPDSVWEAFKFVLEYPLLFIPWDQFIWMRDEEGEKIKKLHDQIYETQILVANLPNISPDEFENVAELFKNFNEKLNLILQKIGKKQQ